MKIRVVYRASALSDAESARDWFEDQLTGLGERFVSLLNSTVRRVVEFPHAGHEVYPGVRRLHVPVFKFRVYYRLETETAVVLAIHHPSREVPRRRDLA